jgi:tetratricopeptide (TPR) repeat protein/CHAT domain-containing protein
MNKYRILFIISILFINVNGFSQNSFEKWDTLYDSLYNNSNKDSALKVAFEMNKWSFKNEGDTSINYAISFRFIGNCFQKLNKYDSAILYYKYSLNTLQKQNREIHLQSSIALVNLGDVFSDIGDYKSAEFYLIKCLQINKVLLGENHLEYSTILNNLGILNMYMEKYLISEKYFKQALGIRKIQLSENHIEYANVLNNLAIIYNDLGDFTKSEAYYKQALSIYNNVKGENHENYASFLNNLAILYQNKGDFKSAEQCYKKASAIYFKLLGEDHRNYAISLNNLGTLYSSLDDFSSAELYFKKSLNIKKKSLGENHPGYATSLINLGNTYKGLDDYETAKSYYIKALNITKNTLGEDHINYSMCLNNLANIYYDLGDFSKSEIYYKRTLDIYNKVFGKNNLDCASILNNLGNLYDEKANTNKAEINYKLALKIIKTKVGKNHPDYIQTENNLAFLYAKTNRIYQALNIYKKNYSKITKHVIDNFQWLSEIQKESYWSKTSEFFDKIGTFSSINYSTFHEVAALNYNASLFMKSRLLENKININKNIPKLNDSSLGELIYKKKLIAKIESEGNEDKHRLEILYKESDSIDKELILSWPEYLDQKNNLSISWKLVQKNLDKNEAAIEFVRFKNRRDSKFYYNALLIRKQDKLPILIHLCKEDIIKSIKPEIGYQLYYRLIWKPLEKYLQGITTIYYSPVGELNNVPFHAISLPNNKNGDSKFVMDRFVLHQLTSTRYLAMNLKKKSNEPISKSIVLVGGVNYEYLPSSDVKTNLKPIATEVIDRAGHSFTNKLEYLEGTKIEVEQINNIVKFNEWSVTLLENNEAKEEHIMGLEGINSKSILHLATHGFVFPEYNYKDATISKKSFQYNYRYSLNPMVRSGLIMTGGNWAWTGNDTLEKLGIEQNGILTALEVSQLDLKNTKLVVLSACETGLGKVEGSEGTFGLKRGFKLAGVDQIIVSLWPVPDQETMELMITFYKDLIISLDPIKSFEKARRILRNKYPNNPENWAGFLLVR